MRLPHRRDRRDAVPARRARPPNPILQQPYEVKDGKLHVPDVPVVGLQWDEKAVAAHLADKFLDQLL